MEEKSLESNPWNNLHTVTTFDKGVSSCSTRCVEEKRKNKKIVNTVSSSSILIGSLLSHLCTILEKDPEQSKKLYFLLYDAMSKMKLIDPSYKLGRLDVVQGKYIDAIYQLITVARATIGSDNTISIPKPLTTYVSLYKDQFREIGFIAGGGFGNVYKAIHKLDEVEYAIKKIIVKPGRVKTILNHLEEVKTLAKLNHTNIVSYKQAWIEPMTTSCMLSLPCTSKATSENSVNTNSSIVVSKHKSQSYVSHKSNESVVFLSEKHSLSNKSESKSTKISSRKISRTYNSSSDNISFQEDNKICDISVESEESSNIIEISSRTSTEESVSSDESGEDRRICQYLSQTNHYAILYIQMALCEKTLRQWLDERVEPTAVPIITAIVSQVLNGLNYIHSLKIVHHDIKPSNIFISTSGKLQIQLGDFGLACPLQREGHDAIVGTCMYAAPEQLKGECNPKSDIYSLGIVLLELLIPMQTSMECIKMVQTLKSGEIPQTLATSHKKWGNVISQLIKVNPIERPSSDELLENLKIDKDLTINKLQNENHKLQSENNKLQNENMKKDQIIEDQELKIKELQDKLAKLKLHS